MGRPKTGVTPEDRFWSRVDKHGPKVLKTICWTWTGSLTKQGYPRDMWVAGKQIKPQRWIYEQEVGAIPEGFTIDHLCRTRHCVRSSHLEAVEHGENIRRAPRFIEQMARTHCPQGHPYSGDNLFFGGRSGTKRQCRQCQRESNRRTYAKKKGK